MIAPPSDIQSPSTTFSGERQKLIDLLVSNNFPVLPVAPAQDPYNYPKVVKAEPQRCLGQHCPLTDDLQPLPLYTGKNPSYLDASGKPHLVNHGEFQNRLPSKHELEKWFANPTNGVGTLGGCNNTIWLDFDVKNFPSQAECDRAVEIILAKLELKVTFVGRTQSQGWRIGVRPKQRPGFTNFALSPGGAHVGEALGAGRFTVLHGIGPSGNAYQIINCILPPAEIELLETIGIYPTKSLQVQQVERPISTPPSVPSSIPLEVLGNKTSCDILNGDCPTGDRSEALATAVQEWYGWQNWTSANGISISSDTPTLAHQAGSKLGIDSARVERILKTINPQECHPAAYYRGSEESCWKKIYRLDRATFEVKCPAAIKEAIARAWKSQCGGSDNLSGNDGNASSNDGSKFDCDSNNQQSNDPDLVADIAVEAHIFDSLFESGNGRIRTIEDSFYIDTEMGYWKLIRDKLILKAIALKLRGAYKLVKQGQQVRKVYAYFTDAKKKSTFLLCRDALDIGEMPANNHLRCFRNCTVDLRTDKAIPHDSAHFLTTSIAAEYKFNEECPEIFLNFVKSAYGEDLIEVIRAYTSMLLDPTAPHGKFIHLIGPSGSGKGKLLRLWGEMFGKEHFRSGDFSNLSTAEGRHQYLTGTALYTVPDVGGYVQGLKPFYELVDNGPMTGRALFSPNAYQKLWNCRFVLASVDHLQIENSGDGWDRRCLPLPTKARTGIEDPHLGSKLAEVKGQIISWALAMPHDERDRLLLHPTTNERVLDLKHDAAIHGDPVRAFVDLCLRPAGNARATIESHQLHSWYGAFCQQHGYQGWGMNKLINHLKTILPNYYVPRRRASAAEDAERRMIPAHWSGITDLAEVFVNLADSEQPSDDDYYDQSTQHHSPQWICVKSKCQEGGLMAFQRNNEAADGSDRSELSAASISNPDPYKPLQLQAFPGNGSGRSGGSAGQEELNSDAADKNSTRTERELEITNSSFLNSCPDPADPKSQNLTGAKLNADREIENRGNDLLDLNDLTKNVEPTIEQALAPELVLSGTNAQDPVSTQDLQLVPPENKVLIGGTKGNGFNIGDRVAHKDEYHACFNYHGIIERMNETSA